MVNVNIAGRDSGEYPLITNPRLKQFATAAAVNLSAHAQNRTAKMDDKTSLGKANAPVKTEVIIEACPFCAHRPVLRVGKFVVAPTKRYMIGCVNERCEVWVRTKFYPKLEETIMAWNSRVSIDDLPSGVIPSDSPTTV